MRIFIFLATYLAAGTLCAQNVPMAEIEGGSFIPLYGTGEEVSVEGFLMDVYPVTNAQYLQFVTENPQWRRSRVVRLFADENYLSSWESDLQLGEGQKPDAPVTNVSWFAAKEYCECLGKRLPSVDEWEYVAMASETSKDARATEAYTKYILSWYETPRTFDNPVGETYRNVWGVYDLHGLVWEWPADFNSVMVVGENKNEGTGGNNRFCDAGAVSTSDLMNYAAFMRYAFRGSLKGNYTIQNLGFRCVQDLSTNKEQHP